MYPYSNPESKNESLVFQVKDYVDDIELAILSGGVLPKEVSELLQDFNNFDLDKLIERKGKDKVLREIENIKAIFEDQQILKSVSDGIDLAQRICPSVPVKPYPIYLIYAGGVTDARAMGGGYVMNFGNLIYLTQSKQELLEIVKSLGAHETVHRFLEQLGIEPEVTDDIDTEILNKVWEEGLTTTIQTVQYPWHDIFVEDYKFWADTLVEWINCKGQEEKRKEILAKCFERDSYIKYLELCGPSLKERVLSGKSTAEIFSNLMLNGNGPAYHLGSVLWKKQMEEGNKLEDMVQKGHKQSKDWIMSITNSSGKTPD